MEDKIPYQTPMQLLNAITDFNIANPPGTKVMLQMEAHTQPTEVTVKKKARILMNQTAVVCFEEVEGTHLLFNVKPIKP